MLTAKDALGRLTRFTYDVEGNLALQTNPLGQVTKYLDYDNAGRLLMMSDPNGLVTKYTYDPRGRMTSINSGSEVTTVTYDNLGNRTRVTNPDGSYKTYTYDQAHRLTRITDAMKNQLQFTLDGNDNRTNVRTVDANGHVVTTRSFTYDNINRMVQEIGALGQVTNYAYDNQGNLLEAVDPLGNGSQFFYDALNRRAHTIDPTGRSVRYAYDELDRLRQETTPRSIVTDYDYSDFDEPTAVISPDTGSTAKTYDDAGNVLTSTDARGMQTVYDYDALNRVVLARFADGGHVRYEYDRGKFGIGHLTRMVDASGATDYDYDQHGRLVRKEQRIGGVVRVTLRDYDKFGRLAVLTYPSGVRVNFSYDANGRVSGMSAGRSWLVTNVVYQPFGPVIGWRQGNNGVYIRGFDLDGRITGITMGGNTGVSIGYDAADRITGIAETGQPVQSFGYDVMDRLTGFAENGRTTSFTYDGTGNRLKAIGATAADSSQYSYADGTNRLLRIVTGATADAKTENYTYDAAGNTLSDGVHQFTYDARGRMVASITADDDDDDDAGDRDGGKDSHHAGKKDGRHDHGKDHDKHHGHGHDGHDEKITMHYLLNGFGQRVAKFGRDEGVAYVYDEAGHVIGQYGDKRQDRMETVWLGDLPVAVIGGDHDCDDLHFISPDHLGAPHIITDGFGRKVWEWRHAPFGETEPVAVGGFQYDLRFPGQVHDEETGLNYNYLRDYNPKTGRYVQSDPIGLASGMNTYSYVDSGPVGATDKLGLYTTDQFGNKVAVLTVQGSISYPPGFLPGNITVSNASVQNPNQYVSRQLGIHDQMPSVMPGSVPCPQNEVGMMACYQDGTTWDSAGKLDGFLYHDSMNLYKQSHLSGQWGSECSYRDGSLVTGEPGSGTANLYPDWTLEHMIIDPGGPGRNSPAYNYYWSTHPHPPGIE